MFWKIWAGMRHLGVLVRIRGERNMHVDSMDYLG